MHERLQNKEGIYWIKKEVPEVLKEEETGLGTPLGTPRDGTGEVSSENEGPETREHPFQVEGIYPVVLGPPPLPDPLHDSIEFDLYPKVDLPREGTSMDVYHGSSNVLIQCIYIKIDSVKTKFCV